MNESRITAPSAFSRRRFLGGALATALLTACSSAPQPPAAAPAAPASSPAAAAPAPASSPASGGAAASPTPIILNPGTAPSPAAAAAPSAVAGAGSTTAGTSLVPPKAPASNASSTKQLIVGHHVDPTTLNPVATTTAAFQSIYAQILEQLVVFDAEGTSVRPWLAESFNWIDPTTLELKLRTGIKFTNGEVFDAASAKFSVDQFAESKFYAFLLPKGVYESTSVVDDRTVRIKLTRPFSPFLGFLARGGSALPPKYYREVGEEGFGAKPIGTGPFMLSEWVKDDRIVLTRNADYWNGPHPFQQIRYRVIPEDTARVAALETGEVDLALNLPVSSLGRLRGKPDVQPVVAPGLRKFAVHFDTKSGPGPLSDKRVRTALNHAVDKQAIASRVFEGAADPLQGQWVAKQEFGFDPTIKAFDFDVAKAKQLLAEAGHPNGFDLQFTYTAGRYAQDKELGEIVANYMKQAGVNVTQRPLEYGTFSKLMQERQIGTHMWGLLLVPDPHFNLSLFVKDTIYEWHDLGPEYTKLVEDGSKETDLAKRQEFYAKAIKIMHDDPPMLYLLIPQDIYGVNKKVKGFQPRTDQVLWLFPADIA